MKFIFIFCKKCLPSKVVMTTLKLVYKEYVSIDVQFIHLVSQFITLIDIIIYKNRIHDNIII